MEHGLDGSQGPASEGTCSMTTCQAEIAIPTSASGTAVRQTSRSRRHAATPSTITWG